MNIDLKGKVAVVSGGATLIGKAVVQALVNAGARVAILDIDANGKKVAESFPYDVMFIQVDLPEPDWPTMATNSPLLILKETWSAAFTRVSPIW